MRSIIMICSVAVLAFAAAGPAFAQTKTVKACEKEWRANKAANQAKGITEKAFVEQCRSGAAAAAPATGTPPVATAPASTGAPSTAAAPARTAAPRSTTATTPRETAPGGANEFTSQAQAKSHCPGDIVVWANLKSHIYHFEGSKDFGKTKSGAFMCRKDANSAGMRAAKNEKQPG